MQTLRAPQVGHRGGRRAEAHPGGTPQQGTDRAGCAAWLLDAAAFHAALDPLVDALFGPDGPEPLREAATALWRSDDPLVVDYLARLPGNTPEEWAVAFEEGHLAQWYRILMAGHLRPTAAVGDPGAVCRALGELGLSAAEARRVTRGRELTRLVEAFASPTTSATIGLTLPSGTRGWYDHGDATTTLEHLRSLDRRRFRHHQDAVPLCEDLYACLDAVPDDPGLVVLLTRC
jgi:hypothetical protein